MESKCPKCKSANLEYGVAEIAEAGLRYPVKCLDCAFIGYEWYSLKFSEYWDDQGNKLI